MDHVVRLCATPVTPARIRSVEELARFSISLRDFEKAHQYLVGARRHLETTIEYEALLFAAIVSYCRPFSGNERGKPLRATKRLLIKDFAPLSEEDEHIHAQLHEARNKRLAHSEFDSNPTSFSPETGMFSGKASTLPSVNLDKFEQVVLRFIDVCHTKRADYSRHARAC